MPPLTSPWIILFATLGALVAGLGFAYAVAWLSMDREADAEFDYHMRRGWDPHWRPILKYEDRIKELKRKKGLKP